LPDAIFEVAGRSKTERVKKGKREVLTDTDSAIIEQYPFGSAINVSIGPNPQTTLKEES